MISGNFVSAVADRRRWLSPLALAFCVVALGGCANMSPTGQRALSGGAIGAAGGAVLGTVAAGNPAVGACGRRCGWCRCRRGTPQYRAHSERQLKTTPATLTPTCRNGDFFVRAELSYVKASEPYG